MRSDLGSVVRICIAHNSGSPIVASACHASSAACIYPVAEVPYSIWSVPQGFAIKAGIELRVGEPAILDGSHSFFVPEPASEESIAAEQRLQSFDIHPSAPWWGRGRSPAIDECAAFEYELCAQHKTTCDALEKAGLSMERRATRAQAQNLSHRWIDDQTLELNFSLSPGLYATTLLREFCTVEEPQR